MFKVLLVGALFVAATSFGTTPASSRPAGGGAKITGGTYAADGAWPSEAALLYHKVADNFFANFCGATVVSRSWVLTSASCFAENPLASSTNTVDVLVGTQNLRSGGQRIRVTAIRFHPMWNRHTLEHDIALVKLAQPTSVKPQALSAAPVSANTRVVALGWGVIPEADAFPLSLQQVTLSVATTQACSKTWGRYFRPSTMLCAGAPGKDVCSQDRGGPLLALRRGVWTQVAITSWGNSGAGSCGAPGQVFATTASSVAWIRQVIKT